MFLNFFKTKKKQVLKFKLKKKLTLSNLLNNHV